MTKYKVTVELEFDEMPTHNDVKNYVNDLFNDGTLQFETEKLDYIYLRRGNKDE